MTGRPIPPTRRWAPAAASLLLAALFLLNIYRAATQSLVHDEAQTYHLYLTSPFSTLFTVYDANHHFLSTVLMRLSTSLFGFSELALRLPTLLAGGWYFITVFRLGRLAFEESWLFLLSVVLAAANPLVLDFLVAARGYGLALACLAFGVYRMVAYLSHPSPDCRALCGAGLSLALAVTANVTLLFPVSVITALVLVVLWKRSGAGNLNAHFLIPLCGVLLFFYVVSPIHRATMGNFYYGAHSLAESFQDLAALSLAHNPGPAALNHVLGWKAWWRDFAIVAGAAVSLGGMPIAIGTFLRGRMSTPRDWLLLLTSVTVTGSWGLLFAAHHTTGLLYPLDRTGLYFLPLAGWIFPGIAAALRDHFRANLLSGACAAAGTVFAIQYLLQPNTSHFYIWEYDADTKAIASFLEERDHPASVRLGISWPLEPALDYYRERRQLTWLEPLTRQGPDGDYDYYVLMGPDQDLVARDKLRVIYRGPVSDTVVAQK